MARRITDADLLIPTLLNAAPSIQSFGELQGYRQYLEDALRRLPLALDIIDATSEQLAAVAACYRSLTLPPGIRGVKGTRLSKILHHKRPMLIPLFDRYVSNCYLGGPSRRIPRPRKRTWVEFMRFLATAVQEDLSANREAWEELRHLAEVDR